MRSLRHIAPQSNSPIYPPLPQGAYIRGQQRRTRKLLELPEAEQSAAIAKEKEEKKVPVDFYYLRVPHISDSRPTGR